jgi:hypothetical protein
VIAAGYSDDEGTGPFPSAANLVVISLLALKKGTGISSFDPHALIQSWYNSWNISSLYPPPVMIARGGTVKSLEPSWVWSDIGGGGFPEMICGTSCLDCAML